MKIDMDENGVITITPETGPEAFALSQFQDKAHIAVNDPMRNEAYYWRGSMLVIKLRVPQPTPELEPQ